MSAEAPGLPVGSEEARWPTSVDRPLPLGYASRMGVSRFVSTASAVSLAIVACSSFESAPEKGASTHDGGAGSETSGQPDAGKGISLELTDGTTTAYVIQGNDLEMPLEIRREPGSTGAITVKVASGLPVDVTSTPVTVPAGDNKGRLLLHSDPRARQGAVNIEVAALAEDGATASAKRVVFVRGSRERSIRHSTRMVY